MAGQWAERAECMTVAEAVEAGEDTASVPAGRANRKRSSGHVKAGEGELVGSMCLRP